MIDLNDLTLPQLNDLQVKVGEQIKIRTKDELTKVHQQILALAESVGMTVQEIMKDKGGKLQKPVRTVSPRYRHPEKAELMWTGRGRKPLWIQEYMDASGKPIESLLIEQK